VIMQPENVEAIMGLARALLGSDDTGNAVQWARRAAALAPANPGARLLLGDALHASGDDKSAEMEWLEAQRLNPASPEVRHRIAKLGRDKSE
jgi:Flp pilus assembly protein TadD